MALCARAALLLGALQVLVLLGAAMNQTDAQGKSVGGEEARCGGLPLHVRLPRGKFHASAVDSAGEGRTEVGVGVSLAHGPPAEPDLLCLRAAGRRGAQNLLSFSGMVLQPKTQVGPQPVPGVLWLVARPVD